MTSLRRARHDFHVTLIVGDHEQKGFVTLAMFNLTTEAAARAFISAVDDGISDETEPDIKTAPFTFGLDLNQGNDILDTGKRCLPLQTAMRFAPDAVQAWLNERPDPNSVMHRQLFSLQAYPQPF